MSDTEVNTMEQQRKEAATDLTLCQIKIELDNYRDIKGIKDLYIKGSIEYDCAQNFQFGYEAAERGDTLIDGFHECFKRGYKAWQPIIGSK
jgi:hypothetical protein